MPRKPRMYIPDVPCHVVQRGNNRDTTFYTEEDYNFYLTCLVEGSDRFQVFVHAYVLMTNHVHLLLTPTDRIGVSRLMQSIGRRYVQYVNSTYHRTGTLWESRHKACLVQEERYLLTCYRYIELNPVRAGMVKHPGEYRWSSFQENAFGRVPPLLDSHSAYLALGSERISRQAAYRELFHNHVSNTDINAIRHAMHSSMPLGDRRFKEQIERVLGRRTGYTAPGRPVGSKSK